MFSILLTHFQASSLLSGPTSDASCTSLQKDSTHVCSPLSLGCLWLHSDPRGSSLYRKMGTNWRQLCLLWGCDEMMTDGPLFGEYFDALPLLLPSRWRVKLLSGPKRHFLRLKMPHYFISSPDNYKAWISPLSSIKKDKKYKSLLFVFLTLPNLFESIVENSLPHIRVNHPPKLLTGSMVVDRRKFFKLKF